MPVSTRQALTAPLNIQQLLAAKQMGLGDYIAQAEMRNHVPSLRERIGNLIYDAAQGAGLRQSAHGMRTNAEAALDFLPGVGEAVGAQEAGRDLAAGNYGRAAVGGLGTAAGVLPVGDLAGGIAKAIFGGIAAKTADKPALELAEKMLKEGASKDEIWNATGWFKGADGKWRFEIDDSETAFGSGGALVRRGPGEFSGTMDEVFPHRELLDAYPRVGPREVTVNTRTNNSGYYNDGTIEIGAAGPNGEWLETALDEGYGSSFINAATDDDRGGRMRGSMLHELQHSVQDAEGFAPGGSPAMVREAAAEMGISEDYAYQLLAGEVEARNIQHRMNMTAAERRVRPPWETQDIPFAFQLFGTK